jgi:hypothetical protein
MRSPENALPDSELAILVARLWPHREHESNSVLGLLCRVGLHRWRRLDLATLTPNKDIFHCFWCSRVKVDGVVYDTRGSIKTSPVPNFAKAGKLSILCDGLRRP